VPDGYVAPSVVPVTAILYDLKPEPAAPKPTIPKPVETAPDKGFWGRSQSPLWLNGSIVANDSDTFGLSANLWNEKRNLDVHSSLTMTNGGLLTFRLSRLAPAPPAWFVAGLVEPFGLGPP